MKKATPIIIVALSLFVTAFAWQKANPEIPAVVKQAFAKEFPGAKAKWDKEKGKYEANFRYGKEKLSVLYDSNGTKEETEVSVAEADLPASVKKYVTLHNPGRIKESAKITKANGSVEYEVEVKGKDLIFASDGTYITTVED